jgi:pyrroloquinoline quinone biosynthesis protein D
VSTLDLKLRPILAPHVRLKTDPVSGEPVLLFPEGLLILNETAQEIVSRCDGRKTIAELLAQLIAEFAVDEETLRNDLLENLQQLKQRNLILFSE